MLSCYSHFGTYTKTKGIIVLFNKKKCKIEEIEIIKEGMLVSFKATIQNESIRILGCYAPSSGDDPEYVFDCKELLDNAQETHGFFRGFKYHTRPTS